MGMLAEPRKQARRKGMAALAGWAGTGVVVATIGGWILPVAGVVASGYLTFDWLRFRGRWGIKF